MQDFYVCYVKLFVNDFEKEDDLRWIRMMMEKWSSAGAKGWIRSTSIGVLRFLQSVPG